MKKLLLSTATVGLFALLSAGGAIAQQKPHGCLPGMDPLSPPCQAEASGHGGDNTRSTATEPGAAGSDVTGTIPAAPVESVPAEGGVAVEVEGRPNGSIR